MKKLFLSLLLLFVSAFAFAEDPSPKAVAREAFTCIQNGQFEAFLECVEGFDAIDPAARAEIVELLPEMFNEMGNFKLLEVEEAVYWGDRTTATVNVTASANGETSTDPVKLVLTDTGWKISGDGMLY